MTRPSVSVASKSSSTPSAPRSVGVEGQTSAEAGSLAMSAEGTISRTWWNAQWLNGDVRQLASVTWPSGAGGKPCMRVVMGHYLSQLFKAGTEGRSGIK